MKIYHSDNIPAEQRARFFAYNGLDTMMTHELSHKVEEKVQATAPSSNRFSHLLVGPVLTMMRRGFLVDGRQAEETAASHKKRIAQLQATLDDFVGAVPGWDKKLNVNSNVQLKKFFYEVMALPPVVRSDKGEMKVKANRAALEYLAKNYIRAKPFCDIINRMKDLKGELDVFGRGLHNGRFLYSFNIGGTETFRYSSSAHPTRFGQNIQNINPELRHIFIADPGYVLFSGDLKGADARMIAYLSGDEEYIKVQESSDGHTKVAAMTWGFEEKKELAERIFYRHFTYRFMAKKLQHGTNFLGGPGTIAQQTTLPKNMVEEFQKKYFKAFPGIRSFQEWVARELQSKGYLTTAFGRRRPFWDRRWDESTVREGVAYLAQSPIADYCHVMEYLLWFHLEPRLQLLVNGHDAVIFQVKEEDVASVLPDVLKLVEIPLPVTDIHGVTRTVVIPTELKSGKNWGDFDAKKNPEGLKPWSPACLP